MDTSFSTPFQNNIPVTKRSRVEHNEKCCTMCSFLWFKNVHTLREGIKSCILVWKVDFQIKCIIIPGESSQVQASADVLQTDLENWLPLIWGNKGNGLLTADAI